MNFFKRALKQTIRKPSKSILLILTFFLIGNLVIIGISVANASETAKTLTRKKMRAVVNYTIDYSAFYNEGDAIEDEDERNEFFKHAPTITYKEVGELLKDERVKTANILSNAMYYKLEDDIDYVRLNNKAEEELENPDNCYATESGEKICPYSSTPMFFVKGNFYPGMIELEEGIFTVVDGRFYNQDDINDSKNVCLVTDELAKLNGLSVGDTIQFNIATMSEYYANVGVTEEDLLAEFEIIGIYRSTNKVTPGSENFDYCYPYENPDNMILAPATTLYRISLPVEQKVFDSYYESGSDIEFYQDINNRPAEEKLDDIKVSDTTLLLTDPLDVDQFVEDHNGNLGKYQKIDANNEEFKKLSKPLDTLSEYAEFIVWLVIVNAIVIITLVTALTLKTREYEIGVLLSMGASKLKIILQFFIELTIVALIGFTLAVGTGSLASKKIGKVLLDNQIESSDINENDNNYGIDYYSPWDSNYNTQISLDDLVSEYDVSVSPLIIAEIYVVGISIVLISVIIPSIMIMRFNPKKILMNQY